MSRDKQTSGNRSGNQGIVQPDWENLPSGVVAWVLWSMPRSLWRLVIWIMALFIAVTAIVGFIQLLSIRGTQIENAKLQLFREQWKRADRPEWKIALLATWPRPGEIPNAIWQEAAEHRDWSIRRAVALHPYVPAIWLEQLQSDPISNVQLPAILKYAQSLNGRKRALRLLARNEELEIRLAVARNKETPLSILKELAAGEDLDVRRTLAENPSTPKEVLRVLAADESGSVREYVAKNPSTPKEVWKELAADEDLDVRLAVAENPSTPKEALKELAADEDLYVRRAVAANPSTPKEVLKEVLKELAAGANFYSRRAAAKNPSTPKEVLKELAAG